MLTSFSRRDFLKISGTLVVSFSASSLAEPFPTMQGPFDTHVSHIDATKLDSWIVVAADETVTANTGKCDFGQGMLTAQAQLVAEELCVSIDRVRILQCDTSTTPDQGTTSGSQSTLTNFNSRNLAQAAATAREALFAMASQHLGQPADQLSVADGVITAKTGGRVTYGELVGGKQWKLALNPAAKRRSPAQWTVLGKPIPSLDRVELATGQFEFVHNVKVPGMVHGRVIRPPEVGATLVNVDEASIGNIPGVIKVVVRKNFVGVVAETQSLAIQAAKALKTTWTTGAGLPNQDSFYDHMRKQPSQDLLIVNSGDVEKTLAGASAVLSATYFHPYQAHGSIGASCAVADVKIDVATVWSATQSVYPTRSGVAALLGLPADKVRVIFVRGSGCYGLNGADAVSYDAALLSHAVRRPVRVQLSRHDEMAWDNFGSACVIEQKAGIDPKGTIVAWNCEAWSAALGGRPGYERPGNIVTGMLCGYEPHGVTTRSAPEPSGELRNGNNMVPSYVVGCVGGKCGGAGVVRSERCLSHIVQSPFFTGPLRSPLRLQNTFAHECFMDEIAAHAGADPLEYRLRHLSETRIIDVLKAAGLAGKWETRASPKPGNPSAAIVHGRGIACVAYEGDNGFVALIAEVEIDRATGRVQVQRFVVAHDCGPVSNPDGVRNQIEGGILQGMSRALGEQVTWDDRKVTSIDWSTYSSLPLGMPVPAIESVLIDRSSQKATGAGEPSITVVAAAIGNAVFDATGARLREVPFTAERVKAALHSSSLGRD